MFALAKLIILCWILLGTIIGTLLFGLNINVTIAIITVITVVTVIDTL